MTIRTASLIAAAAVALVASSASAQDRWDGPPPPGPELRDGPPMPPMGARRFGYSPEQRGQWLDECRANHAPPPMRDGRRGHGRPGPGPDGETGYCEGYLQHYEGMPGPAFQPGMVQPDYITPGYMVPPLMWVRVPIIHERRDCGCEEVVEEEVVTRPAPAPRRAAPRRTHDKRIRYAK